MFEEEEFEDLLVERGHHICSVDGYERNFKRLYLQTDDLLLNNEYFQTGENELKRLSNLNNFAEIIANGRKVDISKKKFLDSDEDELFSGKLNAVITDLEKKDYKKKHRSSSFDDIVSPLERSTSASYDTDTEIAIKSRIKQ